MSGIKSDLIEFDLTKDKCFVCGRKANTVEHLFPKWLQHKFNLWDQKIHIPNETTISYKQLLIPLCKKCNNEVYGQLENKIKSGNASDAEIWRWANKMHFGLTLKNQFLEWDRKNPGNKIGDIISPSDPLEQSRHFLHCVSGDFTCSPDPFGSVFKFQLDYEEDFNFIHIINSQSIYACLGDVIYIVFVKDGQTMKEDIAIKEDYESILSGKYKMQDALFFYAKCIEYMDRYTYSIPIVFSGKQILKFGKATLRDEKPFDKEKFSAICNRFGITWIDSNDINKSP
ncbi:hypothetical protein [Arenibacter sp. ARW7G5Y1]|uniref:hypothetical protein n=1 Tax=Arenibacter sp. ARW7G5Y1 TaxID=2135619 RepID=UPI000D7695E6|nr:hypothetical protein [Arenibacter sp. ARW7G5Y1]PXX30627.1 hypothetical protein C7972_102255 [Arenibacter sp. ARW7G5Y1]